MASISHPQTKSKVDQTRKWFNRIFDFTSTDEEPDKRIYWVLVSIPLLFFLVGLFFLCRNQYGLCTNIVKEDLNPKYGKDFDAEVGYLIVFIRSHSGSATNMIMI